MIQQSRALKHGLLIFSSRVLNIGYSGNNPVFNTYFHWRFIMKDYYENKIAHLKEQIEDLELKIDSIKYSIEN